MYHRMIFHILLMSAITIHAQSINLRGKVSDQSGKAVANAIVTLVKQKLKDTTGSDGSYILSKSDVSTISLLTPRNQTITLNNGFLEFSLPNPSPVTIEAFDVKGKLLKKFSTQNTSTGFYRFNIAEVSLSTSLVVLRATIGDYGITFRYMTLQNGKSIIDQLDNTSTTLNNNKLSKVAAVSDTLTVTASGYSSKSVAVNNYDQVLNVTLDTSSSNGKSAGCGKNAAITKETRLPISSGGKSREYILRLPSDYDPNIAYRLIVSIHCLNGTAAGVASGGNGNNYQYYGLWKLANPTNGKGTTIFCSPEGLPAFGSGLGWANSGGSDVAFIRTMITEIQNNYCVDTTRIFAEGFSMGGSMSYALACAMPKKFRAVCMHSGGGMSGCDGTNRGPVAMYITHGTNDPTCKWTEGYGQNQINDLAQRNGCETIDLRNTCKPTDQSGMTPVTVDYKKCTTGYPCKASIFVGVHTPSPGGEKNTWVDDSTWNYFKQF